MRNIVLTGFMASGKTAAGKIIAERLQVNFADVDKCIEAEQGMPISAVFEKYGEKHFRRLEKIMTEKVSRQKDQVIATGGGAVIDPVNVRNLRRNGVIFWLYVPAGEVKRRTREDSGRPLLAGPCPEKTIDKLLRERERYYAQADHKVDTTGLSIEEVAGKVIALFKEGGNA